MSRENIVAQGPLNKETYAVCFKTRSGLRAYQYDMVDGLQIAAGADPRYYAGQEIDGWSVIEALGQNIEDVAELLAA
jgi:hypothetical protein